MPTLSPFRGVRYDVGRLGCDHAAISAPPYDVLDDADVVALEAAHARNVVRLTLPRDREPGDRYRLAAERWEAWRRDGTLVTDPTPRLYRYRMTFDDGAGPRTTTGVLGALELTPLGPGGVLPHERTLPKAKSDRLDLMRTTHANLEPIWCISAAPGLTALLDGPWRVLATCTSDDVTHEVAAVDDPAAIAAISEAVAAHPVVLADGHHRYETALTYRAERRAAGLGPDGDDQILTFVVELTADELCVRPINRLVRGGEAVLDRVGDWFTTSAAGPATPDGVTALLARLEPERGIGLVRAGGLHVLVPRPEAVDPLLEATTPALRGVSSVITDVTIEPALAEARAEVAYRHDAQACAALVVAGEWDAAILLRPASIPEIRAVADAGVRMPQKTTFFHPKPASGLVLRALEG